MGANTASVTRLSPRGSAPRTFGIGSFARLRTHGRPGTDQGDRGATSAEYAIVVSLIALVIIGAVTAFGLNVVPLFNVPASAL